MIAAAHVETRGKSIQRHETGQTPPAQKDLVLDIRLNFSPGHLLLVDPKGRKTGFNLKEEDVLKEIPTSQYTLSSSMDPEADMDAITGIYVRSPQDGTYRLTVIGTDSGSYLLEVFAYSSDPSVAMIGVASVKRFPDVIIAKGNVHRYEFTFQNKTGCRFFRGGFYGGGNDNIETDQLLTYANPVDRLTSLPAGATSFPLNIFYGNSIIVRSFQAKLNGVDISLSFQPTPDTNQITVLKLTRGRNEIALSVGGSSSSGTVTDNDRFTLIVP